MLEGSWAPTQVGKWGGGAREILTILTKELLKSSIVLQKVEDTRSVSKGWHGGGNATLEQGEYQLFATPRILYLNFFNGLSSFSLDYHGNWSQANTGGTKIVYWGLLLSCYLFITKKDL